MNNEIKTASQEAYAIEAMEKRYDGIIKEVGFNIGKGIAMILKEDSDFLANNYGDEIRFDFNSSSAVKIEWNKFPGEMLKII